MPNVQKRLHFSRAGVLLQEMNPLQTAQESRIDDNDSTQVERRFNTREEKEADAMGWRPWHHGIIVTPPLNISARLLEIPHNN